jgi:zinc protease
LRDKHFQLISLDQIKSFHRTHYRPEMARIYVAGQPGPDLLPLLNKYFGQAGTYSDRTEDAVPPPSPSPEKNITIKKDGAMQSAVRIGRSLFNNHHPDFIPLQVLNTLLGGYFGSRLMTSASKT